MFFAKVTFWKYLGKVVKSLKKEFISKKNLCDRLNRNFISSTVFFHETTLRAATL
jgi:hypothetical protein